MQIVETRNPMKKQDYSQNVTSLHEDNQLEDKHWLNYVWCFAEKETKRAK